MSVLKEKLDAVAKKSKDKTVILDIYATWCGPCKSLLKTLESEKSNYGYELEKFDIEDDMDEVQNMGILAVPVVLVYKNGELSATYKGKVDPKDIISKI